jgi:CRISPR-associated RAMP protein (TIGR02581 family)
MTTNLDRSQLRARYYITGRIVLDTALHVGGRGAATITDSPIIRDGAGRPFIPGSSLKGAFRAAIERIVPNIPGLHTCALSGEEDACAEHLRQRTKDRQFTEAEMLALLDEILCDTCCTFGSTHLASVTLFQDAPIAGVWRELSEIPTQIRDGVGIDRDSERAREGIKFDFEVVPPQAEFDFILMLENPDERDLGLVALGLQEFINGMIPLGGIRSRGLGRCHLEDVEVKYVNLGDANALQAYLLDNRWEEIPADEFVQTHLSALLSKEA